MCKNRNDTEAEYASVYHPLDMRRNASNETTSEIPNIINERNVIIASEQGKN